MEKGTFELIDASDITEGVQIFGSRFVDEIKNPATDKAFERLRLVVQAYRGGGKNLILT